jgi:hypothetical protein
MYVIDLFKDWGGHIFSICGIIGGLFMYYRHDKIIKKQEKFLNELQIKQIKKAEEQELQAKVECNIIHNEKGSQRIRFYNSGQADARNVRIEIVNESSLKGVLLLGTWGPYDLITSRNGYREERMFLSEGHTDALQLRIIWDDYFGKDRSILQSPQL